MLSINQLEFSFAQPGDTTLAMCFDLSVQSGEVLSLIGPSGSGKTSLLNLIAGFLRPDAGSIVVKGREIQTLPPAARPLTVVFQEHNLFPHLDVYTNVALGLEPSLRLSAAQQTTVAEALEKLGLGGLGARKPGQLSGGQRQRVALARALVREQPILLLDEPFAALGPALREEMIELVKTLVQQQQMAALLVSHQPADALLASTRSAFIHNGRIIALEPTENLLKHNQLPEVTQYLGTQ